MSENGQQMPLIERLRRVPAVARVLEHTPNPLGYDTTSIPVGALCREAADRIDELERERDQYHDALIARHGGEPVALLGELDEARASIESLKAALADAREKISVLEALRDQLLTNIDGLWTDMVGFMINANKLAADREARGIDTNRLLCALASARERRED